MPEARKFYLDAIKKTALRTQGYEQVAHMLAAGSVPQHMERGALGLPVDTRFQTRARNNDGSRNWPADYMPADAVPAN